MYAIQHKTTLHSQVLYNLRNEKKEPNLDFSSVEQFERTMLNRKDWHNTTDEIGVLNRPLGKEIEKLSSDVIKEMSEDGLNHFDFKTSFNPQDSQNEKHDLNTTTMYALDSHFEGSSLVVENPDYIKSSLTPHTNSTQYFDKRLQDLDVYKEFEPLEDVYQSTTFWGANDKMSRFNEVITYAKMNDATEEEIANKDFQIEAQSFFNEFYQFSDISYLAGKNSSDARVYNNPEHTMISTNYKGFSLDNIESTKRTMIQDRYNLSKKNQEETIEEREKSIKEIFDVSLEDILPHAYSEGLKSSSQFNSKSEVLDLIKEKKEYLKKYSMHNEITIQLDFLTRLEEKLMEDISTVSMKSDVKFENGRL